MNAIELQADGCCVVAAKIGEGTHALVAVSAHVATAKDLATGKDQRHYLQSLVDAVGPFAGQRSVIGGDLNASLDYDERYYGPFFKGMAGAGFHDCHRALHGREVTSFWGHQAPKGGIQDDHIFVDPASAARVTWVQITPRHAASVTATVGSGLG